jgi:leucyl-tRNA synthetase
VLKGQTYLKGFELGVLKTGKYAGSKVKEVKTQIRADLIASNQAVAYWEPEGPVVSRSGDECVVALCDQWYINYGEETWMNKVLDHLKTNFTMFNHKALNQQESAVEWFKAWACSRTFGLGTRLPWDEHWIIESLSDSTIYMAYYAIAHYLQGNMEGSIAGKAGLRPDQVTDELFDYVFLLSDKLPASLSEDVAKKMRAEFAYWYPMDLRVSGKDLMRNHLTMSLYIHAAIWEQRPDLWPRAFFTNGHIEVDAEKMSKSKGNFLTIEHVNKEYGADATRIALADAGDDLENANFSKKTANDTILGLYTLDQWIQEHLKQVAAGSLRQGGEWTFMDRVFNNEMNRLVAECHAGYQRMSFRGALKAAWFDLGNLREQYRLLSEEDKMHEDLIKKYCKIQTLILFPIAPHFCEHLWKIITSSNEPLAKDFSGRWPQVEAYDLSLGRKFQVLQDSLRQFRLELKKWKTPDQPPNTAIVFVAKEYLSYQQDVLKLLAANVEFDPVTFEPVDRKYTTALKGVLAEGGLSSALQAQALKFAAFHVQTEVKARGLEALELVLPFDEAQMFLEQITLIKKQLGVTTVEIRGSHEVCEDDVPSKQGCKRELAIPAKPSILFVRRS